MQDPNRFARPTELFLPYLQIRFGASNSTGFFFFFDGGCCHVWWWLLVAMLLPLLLVMLPLKPAEFVFKDLTSIVTQSRVVISEDEPGPVYRAGLVHALGHSHRQRGIVQNGRSNNNILDAVL